MDGLGDALIMVEFYHTNIYTFSDFHTNYNGIGKFFLVFLTIFSFYLTINIFIKIKKSTCYKSNSYLGLL